MFWSRLRKVTKVSKTLILCAKIVFDGVFEQQTM